jgi:hypothetical protein
MAIGYKDSDTLSYPTYKGLVMAGYQGWFRAEGDGMDVGWGHFGAKGQFDDQHCTIDLWPDMSEYTDTYPTSFKMADGSAAPIFSSADLSTSRLHFKWMKEYGLDGVFVQRFFNYTKGDREKSVPNRVLKNCIQAASEYDRAIAVMYDLSGLRGSGEDCTTIIEDWKYIVDDLKAISGKNRKTYLHHDGKPVVAIWGIGFPDRPYNIHDIGLEKLIDFLHNDPVYGGCAVMLGVPTWWRELGQDTVKDPYLHDIIRSADIVFPWAIGRFSSANEGDIDKYAGLVKGDVEWSKENGVDYAATIFPGFSWHNLCKWEFPNNILPVGSIPRNGGQFLWDLASTAIGNGAEMIYVAMFDEIDEGTAIFKCTPNVPVTEESEFLKIEEPSDRYLQLVGKIGKMLRGEMPLTGELPEIN